MEPTCNCDFRQKTENVKSHGTAIYGMYPLRDLNLKCKICGGVIVIRNMAVTSLVDPKDALIWHKRESGGWLTVISETEYLILNTIHFNSPTYFEGDLLDKKISISKISDRAYKVSFMGLHPYTWRSDRDSTMADAIACVARQQELALQFSEPVKKAPFAVPLEDIIFFSKCIIELSLKDHGMKIKIMESPIEYTASALSLKTGNVVFHKTYPLESHNELTEVAQLALEEFNLLTR